MTEPVTVTMYWPIKELLPPCTEVTPEMISTAPKILIIDVFLCGGRSQKFYMRSTWSSYGKKKSRTRSKTHLTIIPAWVAAGLSPRTSGMLGRVRPLPVAFPRTPL